MNVLCEIADGVAVVTLNRPDRLNALTGAMIEELDARFHALAIDPGVRCVVVTGAGRGFCAGHDLAGGKGEPSHEMTVDEGAARLLRMAQMPLTLRRMPKPVIAALHGAAAGSGLVLALTCDLRVASRSARFKLAFASAGRCGDPGGAYLLTRLIGSGKARAMFLLDEKLDADQALDAGLVHEVVDDEAFEARWRALAAQLARGPTAAFAAMKRNLNAAETAALEETMALEAPANAIASASHDAKEAAAAFLEKRAPDFRGF